MTTHSESGYTLIELMMVVCLTGILGSMAMFQYLAVRSGMVADGAMRVVMSELSIARDTAIAQRRQVEVDFVGVNQVRVTRFEVPEGTTLLRDVVFEGGLKYGLVDGAGDTPDEFGNDVAAPDKVTFNSDGMAVDGSGAPINHSIFLVAPGTPGALRAVTVLGSTGRVRGYRWAGDSRWMQN